jgi:hypothetical protein
MKTLVKVLSVVGWSIFSLGLVFLFVGAVLSGQYNQEMVNAPGLIDIGVLSEMPTSPIGFVVFLVTLSVVLGVIGSMIVMMKEIIVNMIWIVADSLIHTGKVCFKKVFGTVQEGELYHRT